MAQATLVPIPGTEKHLLANAEALGDIHPEERIEVTVAVRARADSQLTATVTNLANQPVEAREHVTRETFAEQFGAEPADLARVATFAQQYGLAVVDSSSARRSVVLSGPVSKMRTAFGVDLKLFAHPGGGTFRGREGLVSVPSELAEIVVGVFGLDDRPAAGPHMRRLTDLAGGPSLVAAQNTSFTPAQVGALYGFPTDATGQGQCIAIIELGGGFRPTDLRTFFQQLGLSMPKVVTVSVDHGRNQPSNPSSADGEVMLDIEVAGAVAPGATLAVYFAPNTDQGFIDAISTAVHDTTNRPSVISISWGSPEVVWTQASVMAMDQAFQAAAAMGVTIYCAAGDNGANDFPPGQGSQPGNHADFPASSPHVVGCGGTNITVANNAITREVVWNDPGGGATGGGFSALFPVPAWQKSVVTGGKRGVPDVAGDASPQSGYVVRVDGQQSVIGGTSAVAPLWAGLTALINQKLGKPLGFAAPAFYGLATASHAFVDITEGNNNGFNAAAGWDPCTGLGRPDGTKLLAALSGVHSRAASTS